MSWYETDTQRAEREYLKAEERRGTRRHFTDLIARTLLRAQEAGQLRDSVISPLGWGLFVHPDGREITVFSGNLPKIDVNTPLSEHGLALEAARGTRHRDHRPRSSSTSRTYDIPTERSMHRDWAVEVWGTDYDVERMQGYSAASRSVTLGDLVELEFTTISPAQPVAEFPTANRIK